jgi:hypothetical protein
MTRCGLFHLASFRRCIIFSLDDLANDTHDKKLFDILSMDDTLLRKLMWDTSHEAAAHNKHGNHGGCIIINPALLRNKAEE